MRVYKISYGDSDDMFVETPENVAEQIVEIIREADIGDAWTVTPVEMDEAEFRALPEHEGW